MLTMLRLRRSRIVIFLSLVACFLFYNLYTKTDAYRWATSTARPANYPTGQNTQEVPKPVAHGQAPPATPQATTSEAALKAIFEEQKTLVQAAHTSTAAAVKDGSGGLVFDTGVPPKAQSTKSIADIDPVALGKALGGPPKYGFPETAESSSSSSTTSTTSELHWTKMPEHFPVPTESIITLPSAKPKQLPKVQHKFKDETALEKGTREKRQAQILKTFKKSWDGYVEHAWLHDELRPKTGGFKDPFCGWAATLVDSLDSLLIMGLEDEFAHALKGLAQIDFTTSQRRDIPLFETTIRYMGGLLSAYDLSGHKHQIILDKAIELGEILIGAFDTPNRMPQTFYSWRPAFVMNPHRAGTRVVMAELGSLSMEFTRLAQITGDDKYYDAIARITDEMEDYQKRTKIPGLWPMYIDASGCKKPDSTHQQLSQMQDSELREAPYNGPATTTIVAKAPKMTHGAHSQNDHAKHDEPKAPEFDHVANKGRIGGWDDKEVDKPEAGKVPTRKFDGPVIGTNAKRQLDSAPQVPQGVPVHDHSFADTQNAGTVDIGLPGKKVEVVPNANPDCLPMGLASPPGSVYEDFTFGGMADSTYEYLPKQFALLGGNVNQYQSMYESAIEAANKWLLFRPMTPNDEDILILGTGKANENPEEEGNFQLNPNLEHLLCFAGGMYGLGAKLFDRPKELDIAKQMTDACVWAYSITSTGIMPEGMEVMPCDSLTDCKWNQSRWENEIDPFPETRIADGKATLQRLKEAAQERVADVDDGLASGLKTSGPGASRGDQRSEYLKNKEPVRKRGLDVDASDIPDLDDPDAFTGKPMTLAEASQIFPSRTRTADDLALDLSTEEIRILPQAEYVASRTKNYRLPKGVPRIGSRSYILRPEAIESVFYMYRITGDPSWREKGWKMFEAVQAATDTTYGASAIRDVLADDDQIVHDDSMESFWLAETLKYFYLLFSDEDVINLDEWVLNTEAHPFRRPT